MNIMNKKVVYAVFPIFKKESENFLIKHEGYSLVPCYLISEVKIYVNSEKYKIDYVVVPIKKMDNLNEFDYIRYDSYGNVLNGSIVSNVYDDINKAYECMAIKNEKYIDLAENSLDKNYRENKVKSYEKYFDEYENFKLKRTSDMENLYNLEVPKNTFEFCHECGEYLESSELVILNNEIVCHNCYLKSEFDSFVKTRRDTAIKKILG